MYMLLQELKSASGRHYSLHLVFKLRGKPAPSTRPRRVRRTPSRGGGPVAVRPSQNPSVNEPVAQTYLIQVEILDPDGSILPNTQAKVKIHLQWRSGAWWVTQKIASALDWGLW